MKDIIGNKQIDKVDIQILHNLYINNKLNELNSFKIKEIIECTNNCFNLSYYTYVNRVNKLLEYGLIGEGIKDIKAKTFYISKNGIDYMENNVFNKINVYDVEEN